MPETTFDKILNFIMPYLVFLFIFWILYKIPVVQKGIESFRNWNERRKERLNGMSEETTTLRTITYE